MIITKKNVLFYALLIIVSTSFFQANAGTNKIQGFGTSYFSDKKVIDSKPSLNINKNKKSLASKLISVKLWWYTAGNQAYEPFPECFRVCDNNVKYLFYKNKRVANNSCNSNGGGTDEYCTGTPDRSGVPATPVTISFYNSYSDSDINQRFPIVNIGMQGNSDTICANILNTKFNYHNVSNTRITCLAKKVKSSDSIDHYDVFVIFTPYK